MKVVRSIARALVVGIVLLTTSPFTRPAVAQDESAGFTSLLSCIQQQGSRLSVLMLFDESASLSTGPAATDPGDLRVVAGTILLRSLARLAETSAATSGGTVEVSLAGFGRDFTSYLPWTELDDASARGVEGAISAFASRDTELDTDFLHALRGSQVALATQEASAPPGVPTCQALVLFTDGEYSIDSEAEKDYAPGVSLATQGGRDSVVSIGKDQICTAGRAAGSLPWVDRLRKDGVAILTVALDAQGASGPASTFMRSLSVGGGGCGTLPASGAAFQANNSGDLLDVFVGLGNSVAGGSQLPIDGPSDGHFEFSLYEAYSEVRFLSKAKLGAAFADRATFRLVPPAGDGDAILLRSTDAESSSVSIGGAVATYNWPAPGTLELALLLPGSARGDWVGRWRVELVTAEGSAGTTPTLEVPESWAFGRFHPTLEAPTAFTSGESSPIVVSLVDTTDDPIAYEPSFGNAVLTGAISPPAPDGTAITDLSFSGPVADDATLTADRPFTPADDLRSSQLRVSLDLTIAVPPDGLPLRTSHAEFAVKVKPPASYPRIREGELDLGGLTGTSKEELSARGALWIEAGASPGGCVWFGPGSFDVLPQGVRGAELATDPAATDPASCIHIEPGDRPVQVAVTLTPRGAGLGKLQGTVVAHLSTSASTKELQVAIPIQLAMAVEPNRGLLIGLFVLLFLVGLGGPIGFQYFLAARAAHFEPPLGLWRAEIPVVIDRSGIARRQEGRSDTMPLDIDPSSDVSPVSWGPEIAGRPKEIEIPPITFRARPRAIPFLPPHGTVIDSQGRPLVSRSDLVPSREANVPLEIATEWVFVRSELEGVNGPGDGPVHDERGPSIVGTLYLLSPRARSRELDELRDDVVQRLPKVVDDFAAFAEGDGETGMESAAPTEADVWGIGAGENGSDSRPWWS